MSLKIYINCDIMKSIECLTTLLNKRLWDILSNLVLNFSIFIKEISMFKNKKKKKPILENYIPGVEKNIF